MRITFFIAIFIVQLFLGLEGKSQSFTENFISDPCGGAECNSFSRTLGGVQFNFVFEVDGESGKFLYQNINGESGSSSIRANSTSPNLGTTEKITITRNDGGEFVFNSIYIDNALGEPVTIQGYNSGSTVGSAQTAPTTNGGVKYNFGGLTVDEVRLTCNDFYATNFDSFSGEIPATAPSLTTSAASSVTSSGATLNGDVTSDGGASITERGFVYALTSDDPTPTVAEVDGTTVFKQTSTGTTGAFNETVSGLTASNGYSYVAYATNSVGTTEGSVETFTTEASGSIFDFDTSTGNTQNSTPDSQTGVTTEDGITLTYSTNGNDGGASVVIVDGGGIFGTTGTTLGNGHSSWTVETITFSSPVDISKFHFGSQGASFTADFEVINGSGSPINGVSITNSGNTITPSDWTNVTSFTITKTNSVSAGTVFDQLHFTVGTVSFDSNGDLVAAGGVSEPVGLPSTIASSAGAVDVFDFSINDGGGDGFPINITAIDVNVSGTSTDDERGQVTWRLNGPDASNITGTYNAGTDKITFSGLNISIPESGSEAYTINAYYNDNTGLTEDHTFVLGIDGDTDLTMVNDGTKTQMGTTSEVNNGSGSTIDISTIKLAFTTQPGISISGSALGTQPVITAQDAAGNTDTDFTEIITLTENSAGTLSNNTQSATSGVATFTNLTYTATADQELFTLTANDEDGVNTNLPTTDANAVTSDVIATKLLFTEQPAPTSFNAGERVTFTTVPVVSAVDANDIIDTGYGTDIVLSKVNGAGSVLITGTGDSDANASSVTITPSSGTATFTGLELQYTLNNPSVDENFNLQANSGGLSAVNSTQLTAFGNQPPVITSSNTASVDENKTAVLTVTATDADSDPVSFSITGGTDQSFFSINSSTGALSFKTDPDFEAKADADNNNEYIVQVTASDSKSPVNQTITVTLNDLNDESPSFTSPNTADVDENTTAVLTVTATDADAGSSITYSIIGGDDQALFSINGTSGALSFDSGPDHENPADNNTDNDYLVTVRASDGTNTTDQTITVSVQDTNDNSPVINSTNTASINENDNSTVITVTATDADATSNITYNITGGVDQGLFSINNTSGALTFDSAPDAENPADDDNNNAYIVEVTATDGTNTDVQTITVTVNDVNDIDPVVTASQSFSIDENSANSTSIGTVVATDNDVTATTFQSWTITGGNTGSAFAINGSTGEITVATASAIDRESTASFTLQVTVSDGTNTSASENVTIDVNDLNDVTPVITASQSFSIDENSANTTSVGTVAATDGDVTATTFQDWTITNGNTDGAFAINASTGELTVANTTALDRETTASFTLQVTVSDGTNTSSAENVTVDLNDLNDNNPVFQNTPYSKNIVEDASIGTSVLTVEATDEDAGTNGQVQYNITNGNTNSDFTIDTNTGEITSANTLDRNTTPTYSLEVTATDQGTGNLTAMTTVSITVNDVNDNAPVIQNEPYTASLNEDVTIGEAVATITATDADDGINAEIAYSITNGNTEGKFTIDSNTGAITIAQTLDYETTQSYTIEVTASDKGTPTMTDVTNVSVTVNDVNDNAPVFQGEPYTASIAEDAGTGTSVISVSATDDDSGVNGQVSYGITGGNTGNALQIDSNTGAITTAGALDRETTASYSLEVTATDAGTPAQNQTSTVTVTITDVNDNAPVFTGTPYSAEVSEDAATGTSVFTVNTTDADEGTNAAVQYSISGGNTNGYFSIDATSGEISVNNTLDRETLDNYSLEITATDQGAGNLNNTTIVSITVTDANDNAPVAGDDAYETDEDTELQVAASGVLTNDTDEDLNTTLTATVVDQPVHGTLALNADGSFSYTPDADYNGADSFTYQANDGNANSNTATVNLTVNAVNDAPTVTTPADQEIEINTSSELINFTIDDIESDATTLNVTATSDNTTLLPASGISLTGTGADQQLTLTPANDETGSTEVTITVSDGDKEATATFTLTVYPVNVAPTDITLSNDTFIESIGRDKVVGTFSTTDENKDDTHVYDLVSGEGDDDNDFFYIEKGTLFTNAEYDYESDSLLSIRVRTTDKWGETFEKTFEISLIADPELELDIPTAFTPNNDGENDSWEIDNITLHPDAMVKVFNRNGQVIFSSLGYEKEWDGTYNGKELPFGTYYYIIDLNDAKSRTYKGTVMIIH